MDYKEQWVASVEAAIKQKNIMTMVLIFLNNVLCYAGWG